MGERFELAPSHAGLEAILDEFPDNWNQLSIAMGVSIGSVGAGRTDYESKLKALQKWVDGKIDRSDIHPGTWSYFLETVREKLGRRPAEKFERKLDQKFEAWTCTDDVNMPPSKKPAPNTRIFPPTAPNAPKDVSYVIMTANQNEWKSSQHFLGVNSDVSDKVKGRTFMTDEFLKLKIGGIDLGDSLPGTTYNFFTVKVGEKKKSAVLLKCDAMGSFTIGGSLCTTFDLLNTAQQYGWPLEAIFIVGCCGASAEGKEDQTGSVFVAKNLYYYGLGKIIEGFRLACRFEPYILGPCGCETLEGEGVPMLKVIKQVSFLSGDFVMKSEEAAKEERQRLGEKKIGFEMEGVGVEIAVNKLYKTLKQHEIPKVVLLKGVSDHAGAQKNNNASITFFSEKVDDVDEDARQQMCTIMSLTVALRAICKGFV